MEACLIQPARPEALTLSQVFREGPFRDRRQCFINFQVPMLYREAYGVSVYRMDYPEERDEAYCVDIVVPRGAEAELPARLRDSLQRYFGWSVRWETREMETWGLSPAPGGIALPGAEAPHPHQAAGDHFRSPGATIADFANYLESYGLAGMPGLEESRSTKLYRFDFSFEPENPDTFFEALGAMGLTVKKREKNGRNTGFGARAKTNCSPPPPLRKKPMRNQNLITKLNACPEACRKCEKACKAYA